jgi:hypothetical protein
MKMSLKSKSLALSLLFLLISPMINSFQPATASTDLTNPGLAPVADVFTNSGQGLGGETGNGVALGDLDGDGDLDAFVANDYGLDGASRAWFNDGEGYFTSGQELGTADGTDVALGDLDGDSDLDAVVTTVSPLSAIVWLNQGGMQGGIEGVFTEGQSLGSFSGYGVAIGDVDNDGDLDVLVVGNSNQVWLNDGDGTFTAGPAFPYQFSEAVVLADMDEDGYLDAVIADSAEGSNNRVWWNNGNWDPGPGSFTAGSPLPTIGLMKGVVVGNLDEDTRQDIFLVGSGGDQIFWNEGSREFSTSGALPVNDSSWAVALGDVDDDGLEDAVVANISAEPNRLWHNEGGRTFTVRQEFGDEFGLYWSRGVGLANLNADEAPDLFEVTTAEDRVWFNTAAPPIVPNEEGWQIQALDTAGESGLLPSMELDANGHPHIAYVYSIAVGYDDEYDEYIYEHRLRYTHWDGVRWHARSFPNFTTGIDTAIALDNNGYTHITFTGPSRLGYVRWDGAQWQDVYVPIFDNHAFAFALDSNDEPHFAYVHGFPSAELLYTHLENGNWLMETITTSADASNISLKLDGNDNPHLSYFNNTNDDLVYAHRSGSWQTEVVDDDVLALFGYNSLALDGDGHPHIAYSAWGAGTPSDMVYAQRIGTSWQIEVVDSPLVGADFMNVSLTLDSSGEPHLFYTLLEDYNNTGTYFKYATLQGNTWQISILDHSHNLNPGKLTKVSAALDASDLLHAAYHEPRYGDLRYQTWGPNWQTRTLPDAGTISSTALDVDTTIPNIAYYNQTGGQVKLARWDEAWDVEPLDFVADPVTDLAVIAEPSSEQVSYYDADNQRLLYQYRDLAGWHTEVVDEAGDVGRYNDLVMPGSPRIAYWDATSRRVKLAVPVFDSILWDIYPNLAGPALDADSGSLSAAVFPGGDVGVAYYDGLNGDLRLAVWDVQSGTWTDELVDGSSADVGSLNSLKFDAAEGTPVVAYLGQGSIHMAYKVGDLWEAQDVPETGGKSIASLSLELGLNSRHGARIAYRTSDGMLSVASLRNGVWQTEEIASGEASPSGRVSTARDVRLHLAYSTGSRLEYAFRTATLEVDASEPGVPPPAYFGDGYYNPLDACQSLLDVFAGDGLNTVSSVTQAILPADSTNLNDDHRIFNAMTALFNASPGGQAYVDLYRQHGAEMGQLGLQDPGLLWDAYGTLQNFIPSIKALVAGEGENVVVTQEMVDDALSIWQRLAAAGSPELTAAINEELAKYNDLQDFVGLNFNQWAHAIGVEPPAEMLYIPVIVKNH